MHRPLIYLAWALGVVTFLIIGLGLNVSYDFGPFYSWSLGRARVEVDDGAPTGPADRPRFGSLLTTNPVFFITRYERLDPTQFRIVVWRGAGGVARTSVSAILKTNLHRSATTFECRWAPAKPCFDALKGHVDQGAAMTVTMTDYGLTGEVVGRSMEVISLKRRFRIRIRLVDRALSV